MTQTPTDALRLVPVEPTEAMIFAGVLAAMEAATEFMEDDFWKERHLAAIERMKSGDYGSDDERAKGVKVGSTLYRAMLAAAPASPLPGTVIVPGQVSYNPEQGFAFNGWRVEIGDQGPKAGILAIINFLREEVEKTPEEEISEAYFSQSSASPPPGGGDMDWQSVAIWMCFSASVIKSGEPWSDQCQQHYAEAKAAFARLAAPTGEPK